MHLTSQIGMKPIHLFSIFIVLLILFSSKSFAQKPVILPPYKFIKEIPFEVWANSYGENWTDLTKITGLNFVSDSNAVWSNQTDRLGFWNIIQHKEKSKLVVDSFGFFQQVLFNDEAKTLFVCKPNSIKTYTFENNALKLKHIIADYEGIDSITINKIAVSSSGKNVIAYLDSLLIGWRFDNQEWKSYQFKTPTLPFSLSFLDETNILLGGNDGHIILMDANTGKVKKISSAFNSTVAKMDVSPNRKKIAMTDELEVKIYAADLKSYSVIKSNISRIGTIKWLNDDELIIAGINDAHEIWFVPTKKIIQSANVDIRPKYLKVKNPHKATGTAYLNILNTDFKCIDSLKLYAKITALSANNDFLIGIGQENLTILTYKLEKTELSIIDKLNIFEHTGRGDDQEIKDLQVAENGKEVYLGSTYTAGTILMDKKVFYTDVNHWENPSQINFLSDKDVGIVKRDNRFEKWKDAFISFYMNGGSNEKSDSKIFKKYRKELKCSICSPSLNRMINPSGFHVSPNNRIIATYDAVGRIQILDLFTDKLLIDSILVPNPIRKAFFRNDKLLAIIDSKGFVYDYSFENKFNALKKQFQIKEDFEEVTYNQKDLVAVYNSNRIEIFDLNKKQNIKSIVNHYQDHSIRFVRFFPNSNSLIWASNQGTSSFNANSPTLLENYNALPEKIIEQIAFSKDKKYMIMGNTEGNILIYKR